MKVARTSSLVTLGGSCFVAFLVLGIAVAHAPPSGLDRTMFGAYGHDLTLARFLTAAGRFPVYFGLSVIALLFGLARPKWRARVVIAVAGLVVTWQTSDLAKAAFARPRYAHPILAETSFGYPSGHADLSMFFYGIWAYFVLQTHLPRAIRIAVVIAAGVWIVAIGWSRLSLGAHYPSDVIGGYLFGAGWLCVAAFMSRRIESVARSM